MAVIKLTHENFEEVAKNSTVPVVIDFWAPWCGPCRMLGPVIDEIAKEKSDIKVCKVNVDEEEELAKMFGVMSIPTVVLMEGGEVVRTSIGFKPKAEMLAFIG